MEFKGLRRLSSETCCRFYAFILLGGILSNEVAIPPPVKTGGVLAKCFMKVQAHVIVSGLVQGVFFRSTCRDVARQLGVTGWVRNLENDRVEAVFEGEKESVSKMVQWCNKGPPGARVTLVDVQWGDYSGTYNTFIISY